MSIANPAWIACLVTAHVLAGCSAQPYVPRMLHPEVTTAEFLSRSTQSDDLKSFAVANGYSRQAWPPSQWGLKELTLVAWYFHADMRIASARAQAAHAQRGAAAQPTGLSGKIQSEHHSRTDADGPWTLGLELELPLVSQKRRAARAEFAGLLATAAELDVAQAAWTVRGRVRDRYLEWLASREALQTLEAQMAAGQEMYGLIARRVETGLLSARELGAQRVVNSQLEVSRGQQLAKRQRAQGELAAALGLPLDTLERMALRTDFPPELADDLDVATLRGIALRNRLDVYRQLLEFATADAEVKLAVAAQNPGITLGPGYSWDQGDNIWSLAIGVSLPGAALSRAVIREAHARRELAAEQFSAKQIDAISLCERAGAQLRQARSRVAAAQRQVQDQQDQEARILRQFKAGAADRLERVSARIEVLAAQAVLQNAQIEVQEAMAQLEEALQRPLLDDGQGLPAGVSGIPGSEMTKP